jgi:hypothetical protein
LKGKINMKNTTLYESEFYSDIRAATYLIKEKDIKLCAELMSMAFHDDPSIRYLLGGQNMGSEDWRYFNTILKAVYTQCVMLSTDDKLNNLLILFPPQLKTVPILNFFANGGAALPGRFSRGLLKRTINYENNCKSVKSRFITPETWYCMCFVVLPEMQGQGLGSSLIKPVLNALDSQNIPIYLETHKVINTETYKHLGFNMVDVSVIPGTKISQYAMLREPLSEIGQAQ